MLGFIVGTVCLVALVAQIGRHRYGFHGHYGPHRGSRWRRGFGHDHYYRHDGQRGFYGPGSRRAVLYGVLERLDTTPGQDRVITGAVDGAFQQLREVREPLQELRRDLGTVLQRDELDRAQLEALFTRAEGRLRDLRGSLLEALTAIHGALEPEQRKRLGNMITTGGVRPLCGF